MKLEKSLLLAVLVMMVLISSAPAYVVWRPRGESRLWSDAANWDGSEPEPMPGQTVYIQSSGGNWTVPNPADGSEMNFPAGRDWAPVITSAVNFTDSNPLSQINLGVWGSGTDVPSYIIMEGGSIVTSDRIAVGHDDGGYTGVWEQSDGYTKAGNGFFIGYGNNARGEVYISGGEIHALNDGLRFHQTSGLLEISGDGAFYADRIQNFEMAEDEVISILGNGKLYLTGEGNPAVAVTWADWVQSYADAGSIIGADGTGATIMAEYNSATGYTEVYSIPEPATLSMLLIGGVALIRRKRN